MSAWPLQKDCDAFYGNPRGVNGNANVSWERDHLTSITPPFKITYAGNPVHSIRIHRRCAMSLLRVLGAIWDAYGHDQKKLDEAGISIFGGSYNFRLKRGQNTLSMHAYGCAVDFDPARNGFHNRHPHFTADCPIVKAFKAEGWTWGGDWDGDGLSSDEPNCDGMHFKRPVSSKAAKAAVLRRKSQNSGNNEYASTVPHTIDAGSSHTVTRGEHRGRFGRMFDGGKFKTGKWTPLAATAVGCLDNTRLMNIVFRSARPLKIADTIIGLIPVFVVYPRALRIDGEKRFRHHAVHITVRVIKSQLQIPAAMWHGLSHVGRRESFGLPELSVTTAKPNFSIIGDFVVWVLRNLFPYSHDRQYAWLASEVK